MTALGLALAQRLDLPEIVGRILARRGIGVEQAPALSGADACAISCPIRCN